MVRRADADETEEDGEARAVEGGGATGCAPDGAHAHERRAVNKIINDGVPALIKERESLPQGAGP